jgi:hypothetical protein
VRELREPLPQQGVELFGPQPVADRLRPGRVGAAQQAVVERLEADALPVELTLEVFMPVHTQLAGVREVRAELQEERAEVTINGVDVVLVDHGRRAGQPGIRLPVGPPPLLRPVDRRLLLRLADEQHALGRARCHKARQVLLRHLVLPLPSRERDQRHPLLPDEPLDRRHERPADRRHQRRRRDRLPAVAPEEPHHPAHMLQARHVHVQIQPIDPLDLQRHVLGKNLGHRPCYAHPGLRSSGGLHRPSDRSPVIMPGAILPIPPVSRATGAPRSDTRQTWRQLNEAVAQSRQ